jgi:hypothetical protein
MALVHQETWVRFGTNGIGISDHQNRYSNGVRVANWVENEIGTNLNATTSEHVSFTGQSTVQADYVQRDRDPDGNKVTALGNASNVQMVCGPPPVPPFPAFPPSCLASIALFPGAVLRKRKGH